MPTAAGFITKAAIRREAIVSVPTWPAVSPAAADVLLLFRTHDVDERPQLTSHARHTPQGGHQAGSQVAKVSSGPMTLDGVYNGMAVVWAMALGRMAKRIGGTTNPETLASGAYRHTIEIDPVLHSHAWELGSGVQLGDGLLIGQQLARRCTLAIDHGVSTWAFKSAMVNQLELRAGVRDVSIGLSWLAHSLDRSSVTNPDLDSITQPNWLDLVFHQLELRIGPYSASTALDANDAAQLSGFRLQLNNNLVARRTEDSGLYMGEPKRQSLPVVSGAFTAPRYESDALTAWVNANTTLMASAVFTGPKIASTGFNYELGIYLPTITLREANLPTEGSGQQQQAYTFEATAPRAAAAGMPSVQSAETPLIVQVTDDNSAHALYTA